MRIIAGSKRGLKLFPPKNYDTRPITDRVKESLFSVLYKYDVIEGSVVADLFCGTGSFGLEAISRGAKWVTFVEKVPNVTAILERNIEKAGFVAESKVIRANAFKIGAPIEVEGPAEEKYNLVFVDPPYMMSTHTDTKSQLGRLLLLLCEQVAEDGVVSVRTHKGSVLLNEYGKLKTIDKRQWGNMSVTLLGLGD